MLGPLSNASFLLPVEGLRRASHILGVDSRASGPSYTQLQFLTLQSRRPHMDSTLFIPSPPPMLVLFVTLSHLTVGSPKAGDRARWIPEFPLAVGTGLRARHASTHIVPILK